MTFSPDCFSFAHAHGYVDAHVYDIYEMALASGSCDAQRLASFAAYLRLCEQQAVWHASQEPL